MYILYEIVIAFITVALIYCPSGITQTQPDLDADATYKVLCPYCNMIVYNAIDETSSVLLLNAYKLSVSIDRHVPQL